MSKDIANILVNVQPHRLKSILTHLGITQAHLSRLLGRGDVYTWRRINGFKSFTATEDAAIADLVQKATAMQEAANA